MTIYTILMTAAAALIVSLILGPVTIPILHRLKFGQEIREIGPSWHKKKTGTPTMGGFIFIISVIVVTLIFIRNPLVLFLLLFSVLFGAIGFVDDFIKVILKRNLGLTEKQKSLLQILTAGLFIFCGLYFEIFDTQVIIPFIDTAVKFPVWLYVIFALFVIVGATNSVNLTDGVDGLAASVTVVVLTFFTVVAYLKNQYPIAGFAFANTLALVGFLVFNFHPAKVFMGDTGSLYLGGVVCFIAIALKLPLILIVAGAVYVLETLSVIIQVTSFKLTGKRVFKMSPIHHHFEMCGWSEKKIVAIASGTTLVLCVASYFMCM